MIFSWTDPPLAKIYPSSMEDHWPRSSTPDWLRARRLLPATICQARRGKSCKTGATQLTNCDKYEKFHKGLDPWRSTGPLGWSTNQTAHEDDNLELCVLLTETLSSFNLNQEHVPMEGFSHPCMTCYFHGFSCVLFDILGTEASTIGLHTIYLIHVLL